MANDPKSPNSNAIQPGASVKAGLPKKLIPLVNIIRAKMRDYPELNRLVAGKETSDREIALAILETIDDFNTTPPLIDGYTLDSFPSESLLINGALIQILTSVGLLQTRNQMSYSDGQGVQVGVSDKAPMLLNWLNLFTSQYERKKQALKYALNLRGALGGDGVSSEYSLVNGYYDDIE
jgi:hypothetical protein